jgi:predicted RecA/RadA family phage recombinase
MTLPLARRLGDEDTINLTAGSSYSPGGVITVYQGLQGIILGSQNIASGDAMEVAVKGAWELPSASATTGSIGDAAYWEASTSLVITTPTVTSVYIGRLRKAKTSGQTVVRIDLNARLPGNGTTISIAAAGSTQSDAATLMNDAMNTVSAADGTKGVLLPAAVAGGPPVFVYNEHATNGLKIYPATGDDINDGTTNAAITMEGKGIAVCRPLDATTWAVSYVINA